MKITIIGAGAIGGTVGAHLIRGGHEVLLCDADEQHVDAINQHGLSIEGPVENFTVRATAVLPSELPHNLEFVAVAVKEQHTKHVAQLLPQHLSKTGAVLSLQNAVNFTELTNAVGPDRVLAALINFGATVLAPGRILQGNIGTVRVGELDCTTITARAQQLADAVPYAQATANILGFLWSKAAYAAMLFAGATSPLSIAETLENPEFQPLMVALARETLGQCPVAAEGFDGFDPDDLEGSLGRLAAFNRVSAKTHSGIYRDLTVLKRPTEVGSLDQLSGPLTHYVADLIRSIERGERECAVSNLELLATYERAERLGRPLNAVVSLISAPPRAMTGPLQGVPIAIKDIIDIAGYPRGNGNPEAMRASAAMVDAPVIAALRAAGAEIFATTTLLEYAAGALHPEVAEARNPHDVRRTAGGSSGGSAALVGAGVCDVALGTDTGGSIRIPAHYCATVGFKPTYGTFSLEGVEPLAPSFDHVGFLGRSVHNVAQVFCALTESEAHPTPLALRVGIVAGQFDLAAVELEVAASVSHVVEKLKAAGCPVSEVDGDPLIEMVGTFDTILLFEAWSIHRDQIVARPSHYSDETLRLLSSGRHITKEMYDSACQLRERLRPACAAIYSGIDVLLTLAVPYVAPITTPPIDTPAGAAEGLFSGIFNVTGDPAIVIPCGWNDSGLPIGVQLSAPVGSDLKLVAAATYIESVIRFTDSSRAGKLRLI